MTSLASQVLKTYLLSHQVLSASFPQSLLCILNIPTASTTSDLPRFRLALASFATHIISL